MKISALKGWALNHVEKPKGLKPSWGFFQKLSEIAKDRGIRVLSIGGDSDLIVSQVKNLFACKCGRLKKYRNVVWDTMEYFSALYLMAVPRLENIKAGKLAVAASTLEFTEELIKGNGKFKINFRPSVPGNLNHWQVFKDDKQIIN